MRMKWSLEKTLTTQIKTCRSVIDDKGIEYKSIKELAKAYNLTESTIYNRLQKGWDIKDVISKKPDKRTLTGINPAAVECYDHLGNKYTDVKSMCEKYGISASSYYQRLKSNWSLEKTLTTPKIESKMKGNVSVDHKGYKYISFSEMCRHYGFDKDDIVKKRLQAGWSLEKALTTPSNKKQYTDHNGNKYNSMLEMANAYNIKASIISQRLMNGWSIKDALTIKPKTGNTCELTLNITDAENKTIHDHKGNEFSSIKEMCDYWNISYHSYFTRQKYTQNLEEILEKPARWNGSKFGNLKIVNVIEQNFYHVIFKGEDDIWTRDEIVAYKKNLEKNFEVNNHDVLYNKMSLLR